MKLFQIIACAILLTVLSGLCSCGGGEPKAPKFKDVTAKAQNILEEVAIITSLKELDKLESEIDRLKSDSLVMNHEASIDVLNSASEALEVRKTIDWKEMVHFEDKFSEVKDYAYVSFAALKGDSIIISFSADVKVQYQILEERSKRDLIKGGYASDFEERVYIPHDDVFTLYLKNEDEFYYNVDVKRKSSSIDDHLKSIAFTEDTVLLEKSIPHSEKGTRMAQSSVFYQPEVRVLDNAILMYDKTYLSIEIPDKTIEILYRLEITDANGSPSTEDNLFTEVSKRSRTIKIAGMEMWSSEGNSTSVTREILNALTVPEQRDETVDMYFIDTKDNVNKFMKGESFDVDVNYSAIGTPSKNGLIKNKSDGFYYLAMRGTSMKDVKVWVDVLALYEETFDYIVKRKINVN